MMLPVYECDAISLVGTYPEIAAYLIGAGHKLWECINRGEHKVLVTAEGKRFFLRRITVAYT